MGDLVKFYEHWNPRRRPAIKQERPATVIILPVVHRNALSPYGLGPKAERQRLRRKAQRAGPNTRN